MNCPICGQPQKFKAMTDGMEEDYWYCWDCHMPFDANGVFSEESECF